MVLVASDAEGSKADKKAAIPKPRKLHKPKCEDDIRALEVLATKKARKRCGFGNKVV